MLLLKALSSKIQEEFVDEDRPILQLSFYAGIRLYIRYNPYGQYSYQVDFSKKLNDRIRYDNYDDTWPVSTRPHHLHPQYKKEAIESPMNGDLEHDIPFLIKKIGEFL